MSLFFKSPNYPRRLSAKGICAMQSVLWHRFVWYCALSHGLPVSFAHIGRDELYYGQKSIIKCGGYLLTCVHFAPYNFPELCKMT